MNIKAGDLVRCIVKQNSIERPGERPGAGWIEGMEFTVSRVYKYEGYNIYFGGYNDNGVYNGWIEKVKKPKKTKMEKFPGVDKIDEMLGAATKEKEPDKKNIDIEIYRKDGESYFKFSIDNRLEKLYQKLSEKTVESEKWPGHQFYFIPNMTKSESYKQKLSAYRLFDDFGTELIKEGRLNISWLRTVGGKGEIHITENFTIAEMVQAAQRAQGFVKEHFEDSFRDFRIKATITIET